MKLAPAILFILGFLATAAVSPAEPAKNPGPDFRRSLDQSLLLWLPLRNGFADFSPGVQGTTLHGDVKVVPGEGAVFDGDGDFIELEGFDLKDKPFAIAFWMKVTGDFGAYGVFQQRSENRQREWLHFLLREPANLYLGFYGEDTKSKTAIRKSDGWRHIVCEYHDGKAWIWLDGKLDTSERKASFLGDHGKFLIGLAPRWSNHTMSDFQGHIRDFRVYQRALTEFEISALSARR